MTVCLRFGAMQQGALGSIVAVDADVAPIDLDADEGLVKGDAQALGEIDDRVAAVCPDSADEHRSAPAFVNAFCCLHRGRRERSRDRLTEQVDIARAQRPAPRVRHVDEMHRLTYGSLELAPR